MNASLKVVIIEKSNKLLAKVKVSGGGRCNVTHHCFSIAEMVKKYPRGADFLKKAFHHFFTKDTIEWFRERGVELKTEADGRMFPVTDSSQTIIDCLMKEANRYGVEIMMNAEILSVGKMIPNDASADDGKFRLLLKDGRAIEADRVCIASGGYPKPIHFEWLKQTGHRIEDPVPSLFTFNMPGNPVTKLMGISVENAIVKISGTKLSAEGPLLITHWGMSGPAILKLSAWAAKELAAKNYSFTVVVNWLPAFNEQSLKEKFQQLRFNIASQKMANRNPFALPQRLWEYLLAVSGVQQDIRWADLAAKEQNKLIRNLCVQEFGVSGKTTFKEEFVTCGGIELNQVNHHTMESKLIPGMYFAGEVMNTDGITGGFNFQNAWTTGWIAANAIAGSLQVLPTI